MPRLTLLIALLLTIPVNAQTTRSITTRPAATTRSASTQPALTLPEIERLYKHRTDQATHQFEQATQAAQRERLQQLRLIQEKALAAKDLELAIRVRDLLAAAQADLQTAEDHALHKPISLRIIGNIDGKNTLVIRQDRARWQQQQYGWPTALTLNGISWDLSKADVLPNSGDTVFLPRKANFRTAAMVKKTGRNLVEVQSDQDELRILFDDLDPGAGKYDLTIELAESDRASP